MRIYTISCDMNEGDIIYTDDGERVGVAARDLNEGQAVKYDPRKDTEDVLIRGSFLNFSSEEA